MGLIKDLKELKKKKMIDEILNELNFFERMKEMQDQIDKLNKIIINTNEVSKEEIENNKKEFDGKMTPQEFIQSFAGEQEEFYPHGK